MVGPGVGGPEEESSLFSLSSRACTFSTVLSSSSSNTGSVASSGCNELRDTLTDRFPESEGVLEKSHESMVL